jgi:hypothetical protein
MNRFPYAVIASAIVLAAPAHASDYAQLAGLHKEWRAFQAGPMTEGVHRRRQPAPRRWAEAVPGPSGRARHRRVEHRAEG